MRNEVYQDRPDLAFFAKCPTTVKAGDAVLIGTRAAVALDDYNANTLGTVFRFAGTFALTVKGQSTQSPVSNLAINPGDELFATGSFDAATNVTTGLTIDVTRGNIPFGSLSPDNAQVAAGATVTANVSLKENAHRPPQ